MTPLDSWKSRARRIEIGGFRLAYWTSEDGDGEKPAMLLIHGYPTSSWDWTAMWPALRARFRLIALDMLGFGLSDKPKGRDYSIMEQADYQEALLAHLGVGEAHLFAHDYGVTVAQELLARAGESALSFSLRSVAFLNGGLFPEQHRARAIQKLGLTPLGPLLGAMLTRGRLRATFDEIFGPETRASDREIDGHFALLSENGGRRVLHKLLRYIPERVAHRERWVGALRNAQIPLRLINGGADPVSGAHVYRYYLEQIPNADAVLLDRIGHYPHTEAPDAVAAAFFAFHRKTGAIAA